MRLTGKADIDVPLDFAARVVTDLAAWERAGLRRGLDLRRTDASALYGRGASWLVRYAYRGKQRPVEIKVTGIDPSGRLLVTLVGQSAEGDADLSVMALGGRKSRLVAHADLRPRTLAARLLFQSLRLAKGRVQRRFDRMLARLGAEISLRYAEAVRDQAAIMGRAPPR